jgi:DNA-binding GntR family transcriptional regulator
MTMALPACSDDVDARSLAEKAYRRLVDKIVRIELPPGAPLSEKALIAELGIGRTPLRESLQRLAAEGLVNHMPHRGMFVTDISATSVQQIYEFRALIDGHAARLAAMRATEEEAQVLTRLHHELVSATNDNDVDRYVDLDRRYYQVLARAARNIYLEETIPRIFNLHLRLWFLISKRLGGWHDIARSHEEMTRSLADAIARRDPDEAEIAVRAYIARRHHDIRAML